MRKIILTALIFICTITTAHADKLGAVYSTDIVAYIDHLMLPSYNIEGQTVVIARDLERYGFRVSFDGEKAQVNIIRDYSMPIEPLMPEFGGQPAGIKLFDYYQTEIKTFYNGEPIVSYNIDGRMAVPLRSLNLANEPDFEEEQRRANIFCLQVEYYDEEIEYVKNVFYPLLQKIMDHSVAKSAAFNALRNNDKSSTAVADFSASCDEMESEMASFKEFREPYGFSSSSEELWWAMVNSRMADQVLLTIKSKGTTPELVAEYEGYMLDSQEQQKKALQRLSDDLQGLAFFWE